MAIIDSPERFEIGRVVSRTFSVLTRNAVVFLLLSALLTIPILLVTFYLARQPIYANLARGSTQAFTNNMGTVYGNGLTSFLVQIVCTFLLQAAVVQGAISDLNGTRAKLGDSLSAGFRFFLPIVGIAILSYLGILVGFVLLIVPGIMLALAWSVVVPVKVVEQTDISESFGRSRALTKGHRWKILGLVLLYLVLALVISMIINTLMGVSLLRPGAAALQTPFLLIGWVERVILSAVTAVGVASLYYELRLVKEGAGASQLAAAFD